MRQNTLLNVRQMFKAETQKSLNPLVSTSDDTRCNYMLYNTQNWLASEYDWDFLRTIIDQNIAGGAQYNTLPALNYERATQLKVYTFYNNFYQELSYGIGVDEYNISNAAIGQYQTPAQRYTFSDENDYELWPVGQQAQTIRWIGQRPITTLFVNPAANPLVFSDVATFDLDDLLVVLFAAATELQRTKDPAAQDMLQRAQKRLLDVKASYPTREGVTRVRGDAMPDGRWVRAVPIITVAPIGGIPGH